MVAEEPPAGLAAPAAAAQQPLAGEAAPAVAVREPLVVAARLSAEEAAPAAAAEVPPAEEAVPGQQDVLWEHQEVAASRRRGFHRRGSVSELGCSSF